MYGRPCRACLRMRLHPSLSFFSRVPHDASGPVRGTEADSSTPEENSVSFSLFPFSTAAGQDFTKRTKENARFFRGPLLPLLLYLRRRIAGNGEKHHRSSIPLFSSREDSVVAGAGCVVPVKTAILFPSFLFFFFSSPVAAACCDGLKEFEFMRIYLFLSPLFSFLPSSRSSRISQRRLRYPLHRSRAFGARDVFLPSFFFPFNLPSPRLIQGHERDLGCRSCLPFPLSSKA